MGEVNFFGADLFFKQEGLAFRCVKNTVRCEYPHGLTKDEAVEYAENLSKDCGKKLEVVYA